MRGTEWDQQGKGDRASREGKPRLSQGLGVSIATRPAAQLWAEPGGSRTGEGDAFDLGFATRTSPSQKPGLPSRSLTFTAVKGTVIKGTANRKEEESHHVKK